MLINSMGGNWGQNCSYQFLCVIACFLLTLLGVSKQDMLVPHGCDCTK